MKEDNIDKLFATNIDKLEKLPTNINWSKEQGWEQLGLNRKTKMRRFPIRRYAAAVIIFILIPASIVFYFSYEKEDDSAYKQNLHTLSPLLA